MRVSFSPQHQQPLDEFKKTDLRNVWPAPQLMGKGLFFLLAGLALAVHSQPVRVGPLSVAPPELHYQQVLPPHQQQNSKQQ